MKYWLEPLEPSGAAIVCQQRNNGDRLFLADPSIISVEQTKRWIENLPKSSQRLLVKYEDKKLGDGVIGIIRLDQIDLINKTGLIGADIYDKGKGHSYPVYRMALDYLFNSLNIEIAYLEVLETNQRAVHIYHKIGFRESGRWKGKILRNGKRQDCICMYLEAEKWRNLESAVNSPNNQLA